ncbi:phage holin family protein [Denitromonas halophila]|uniref:Phage holin family protein n=1 Tax=Denitromonas halophila TaxID=1629404 RepID=A0A557QKK5_9RHOO|nr:phage holin family protein [Denitromonas halophila]TVO53407.1 phage holin family protein [Denitromonas halophila]
MADSDSNSESTTPRSPGLLASLQRLLASAAEVLRTRMEILSTELEEEGGRIRELLLLQQVALFFLGLGVLLATSFVLMAFWDDHRLVALGVFAALYLSAGVGAAWFLRRKLKHHPRLFNASLSELRKDRERLSPRP